MFDMDYMELLIMVGVVETFVIQRLNCIAVMRIMVLGMMEISCGCVCCNSVCDDCISCICGGAWVESEDCGSYVCGGTWDEDCCSCICGNAWGEDCGNCVCDDNCLGDNSKANNFCACSCDKITGCTCNVDVRALLKNINYYVKKDDVLEDL
ncbi:hypothetical protein C2G38_2047292 [Gigaspora rosea]|uniref:Uncharacterized protein n=1 Tax=Gigaspora rosea TaxID=44941 RepID=A0A397UFC1_9GLOM|nr:hypothetical protein C2G38_2047292 [Gigaspora rosea]